MVVKINTSSESFCDDFLGLNDAALRCEVARLLRVTAQQVEEGYDFGVMKDDFGRKCGTWLLDEG